MIVHSLYNPPCVKPSESGRKVRNLYQEEIKKGKLTLVKTGERSVWDLIQSHAEECKIENILHAVAMGDLNALKQRETVYADATTMPKTLMEAQNLVLKMKDEFYKLPLEVRKEFDNSPEMYVEEMGTQTFMDKMSPYNDQLKAIEAEKNHKEYLKKVSEGAQLNIDIAKEQARLEGGKTE